MTTYRLIYVHDRLFRIKKLEEYLERLAEKRKFKKDRIFCNYCNKWLLSDYYYNKHIYNYRHKNYIKYPKGEMRPQKKYKNIHYKTGV